MEDILKKHVMKALGPIASGSILAGRWRLVETACDGDRMLMIFVDAHGNRAEIVAEPAGRRVARDGDVSANFRLYLNFAERGVETDRLVRAVAATFKANDVSPVKELFSDGLAKTDFASGGRVIDACLSNRCGNRCLFCGSVNQHIPELDTEQVVKLIAGYVASGYETIELSSKEFTLRADAPVLISAMRDAGLKIIHLVSNGQQFGDYDFMARILDSGVNKLTLSLHSDNPEDEARITTRKSSFGRKLKGIENVLEYLREEREMPFSINTVLTGFTARRIDGIIAFVSSLGVKRHNVFFPKIHEHMLDMFDCLVPGFSTLREPLNRGMEVARATGTNLSIVDVPSCVYSDDARTVFRRIKKDIFTLTESGAGNVFYDARNEKVKGGRCEECVFFDSCEGVFKRYVDRMGWEEFTPVRGK